MAMNISKLTRPFKAWYTVSRYSDWDFIDCNWDLTVHAKNSLQHLLCQQQSTSLTYQKYPTFFPSYELIEGKESLMTAEVEIDIKN